MTTVLRHDGPPHAGESLQRAALRVLCKPDVARKACRAPVYGRDNSSPIFANVVLGKTFATLAGMAAHGDVHEDYVMLEGHAYGGPKTSLLCVSLQLDAASCCAARLCVQCKRGASS